jgi:hypothetical protein
MAEPCSNTAEEAEKETQQGKKRETFHFASHLPHQQCLHRHFTFPVPAGSEPYQFGNFHAPCVPRLPSNYAPTAMNALLLPFSS